MNNYNILIKEHQLKVTPQRLAIVEFIDIGGHINIENLYIKIKENFSSISLATIYKNITQMLEKNLLQEVKLPNEKSVYEISKNTHSHLLCNVCKNITDVYVNVNDIKNSIKEEHHFDINQSDLVLSGTCKSCSS